MSKYASLAQVERALDPYVAAAHIQTGKQLTIQCTLRLAELAGNPQDELTVLHVAGTSGKTSTSYYIADLLARAGKKVGLTVSPHMDSITERVQINGTPLPDDIFCDYFSEFMGIIEAADETPTYFELMMVFAYWVFRKEKVDYAVIETGLGGLHDSSNIASRRDKLCVLTDIGYDHMHVLGRAIEEIAAQKVGIVKPGNVLVMHEQTEEIMSAVAEHINAQNATLLVETDESETFQERNWHLAYRAYEHLRERDSLMLLDEDALKESQQLHVPGRMDIFKRSGKTIVLDGAHNEQKMSAFLVALTRRFPERKFPILIALKQGKELEYIAPLVAPYTQKIIATELTGSQDSVIESVETNTIAQEFHQNGVDDVSVEKDAKKALATLLEADSEVVIVTGSLYLVAEMRKLLRSFS